LHVNAPNEVVAAFSFLRGTDSREHQLVRAFRAGSSDAFSLVYARVRDVLLDRRDVLLLHPSVAVAVPGHGAGARNLACESLIERLSAEFPHLVPGPGLLVRVEDGPEAKGSPARDSHAEVRTLRWHDDLVPAHVRGVLLVDDVVASGHTLTACFRVLPAARRSEAHALVVARALDGGPSDGGPSEPEPQ